MVRIERKGFKMLEKTINGVLNGDVLKSVLNFAEYLEANEMVINGAEISYKGEAVCYMHLDDAKEYPSPWTIWTEGDYSSESDFVQLSDQMKETAWEHINNCGDCGASCNPGQNKVIFGKAFEAVCNADMAFYMPDAQTLECVKKLLEMRRYEIDISK